MPIQEKFWVMAMWAACFYACHLLLVMQVDADVGKSGIFVLSQRVAIVAVLLVLEVSFLSGYWRRSNTPEMLMGIAAAIFWYLFWEVHDTYTYQGLFAAAFFSYYTAHGPNALLTLLNICVAPVVIATAAGLTAFQSVERYAHKGKKQQL